MMVLPPKGGSCESRIFSARRTMRFRTETSRYTQAQIGATLQQSEDCVPVAELCREHEMSNPLFYKWQAKRAILGQ